MTTLCQICVLASLTAGAPSLGAARTVSTWTLVFGPGSTAVTGWVLADGYTFLAIVRPGGPSLHDELAPQLPAGSRLQVFARPDRSSEVLVVLPWQLTGQALMKGRDRVAVELRYATRVDALRARLAERLPRSVPSDYTAPRFREAEADLKAGRLASAEERFRVLAREHALQSWAELRRGDVAVLQGDIARACSTYGSITENLGNRSAAAVAALRWRTLGCQPAPAHAAAWTELARRIRETDGAVGRYLWAEMRWALVHAITAEDIAAALALDERRPARGRLGVLVLAPNERRALVARAVRLGPLPYDIALAYRRYGDEIARHPEGKLLIVESARALLDLGLDEDAAAALARLADSRVRHTPTPLLRAGVGDGRLASIREQLREGAPPTTEAELSSEVRALEARLDVLLGTMEETSL